MRCLQRFRRPARESGRCRHQAAVTTGSAPKDGGENGRRRTRLCARHERRAERYALLETRKGEGLRRGVGCGAPGSALNQRSDEQDGMSIGGARPARRNQGIAAGLERCIEGRQDQHHEQDGAEPSHHRRWRQIRYGNAITKKWSGWRDSNPRPLDPQAGLHDSRFAADPGSIREGAFSESTKRRRTCARDHARGRRDLQRVTHSAVVETTTTLNAQRAYQRSRPAH
jgi:hypothetical protein